MTTPSLPSTPDQLVTSSELVRHFGLWQDRAARAPVYILHRGRPRFVLVSVETMEALCAPHAAAAGSGAIDPTALLDAVSDLVLVAGEDLRIVAASRAARVHFGSLAAPGARLDGIMPLATRALLGEAIRRVAESGVVEPLEFPSPVRAGRMLAAMLVPVERGVALFAQDGSGEREHARTRAITQATAQATAAGGSVAVATLSPRGYIVDPGQALVDLTRLARDALAMIRFVALSEIGGRVALGDALERVLTEGSVEALDMLLLVNRSAPLPVRVALAPVRTGLAIDSAVAVIVATPVADGKADATASPSG